MMNAIGRSVRTFATGLGILALCAMGARAAPPAADEPPARSFSAVRTPETVIQDWPGASRSEARVMIAKYGEPSGFDDDSLVWFGNGEWRKTVVYRKAPRSFLGYRGRDVLEQWVAYDVPDRKLAELKSFDDRIKYDKPAGEISARSENESLNYLVLNLADEIVADKRNVQEARDFYRKTRKLSESGKFSSYMDGLLFRASKGSSSPEIPGGERLERGGPIESPNP